MIWNKIYKIIIKYTKNNYNYKKKFNKIYEKRNKIVLKKLINKKINYLKIY